MSLEPVEPLRVPLRKSAPATISESVVQSAPQRTRSLPVRRIRPLPPIPTSSASTLACQNSKVAFSTSRPFHALPPLPTKPNPVIISQDDDAVSAVNKKDAGSSTSVADDLVASSPRLSTGPKKCTQRPKLRVQIRPISQMSTASSTLSIPRPPSPTTARKKRMSKLRRHLGREVPDESAFVNTLQKADLNSSLSRGMLPEKNENRDSWQKRGREKPLPPLTPLRPDDGGGATCYREKHGLRWEESNHIAVLQVLRRLHS